MVTQPRQIVNPGTGLGPSLIWGRIHDAAKEDNVELLRDIVEARNGAPVRDIDIPSAGGLTPLHVAALSGSNRCLAYLLSRNAGIHVVDSLGRLAIHWAADGGHADSIMHLVSAGQSINFQDRNGNTALHLAARNGKVKAGQYLIRIGADMSLRNERGWTPVETATTPLFRAVMEMLEQSLPTVNQLRRDHDARRLRAFLLDCGMDRYEENIKNAGYTAQHLLNSCRSIILPKMNEKCTRTVDRMNQRDYLLLLEAVQSYQGTERYNPFAESVKRQKVFDENPAEYKEFLIANPDYETNNADGSEYRRKVLPKEKAFMDYMQEVLNELKANDKQNLFDDMLNKKVDDTDVLMFPQIQEIVDSGWKDVKVLDLNQIQKNIYDGMYQCWEQFQLDCFMMISNVWIFCRAVQSDARPPFKAAVSLAIRGMRIFKKHNNALKKRQAAYHKESKEKMESLRRGWTKIAADKRLRGFLPDRFKERLLQAEEDSDTQFKKLYPLRFDKVEEAFAHWGYRARTVYETARCAWEEDERAALDHHFLVEMLNLTSSRDTGRHFQHPAEDVRSDMHIPGGENPGPFTVENFVREVVWPMDFSAMRQRIKHKVVCDHHKLHPDDYFWLEQVQLDWLIIVFDAVVYHNKFHLEAKKAFDLAQQPPFSVPRAPCSMRLDQNQPQSFECKIVWDQPEPKLGEKIIAYEIQIVTNLTQTVDPARTLAKPGETSLFRVSVESERQVQISELECNGTIATPEGGALEIVGLYPSTNYTVLARSIGLGDIFSPLSGSVLEIRTKSCVPEPPSSFRALSVSVDNIVFAWNAPRDNGVNTIDYEVEYTDLTFSKTFFGRVGWNTTTFSTACVLREPDGSDALSPGLFLPYQQEHFLPATPVQARVRARNSEGWGPWNTEGYCIVNTRPCSPLKPNYLAVVAEGHQFVDIAWMPPIWSNSDGGIVGYIIELVYDGLDGSQGRQEYVAVSELEVTIAEGNFHQRPLIDDTASLPSRPSSAVDSRGSRRSSAAAVDTSPRNFERRSEFGEYHLEQDVVEAASARTAESNPSWWKTTEFVGKISFAGEIPSAVQHRASLDYPVINNGNNLIIFQDHGPLRWEQQRCVVIPAMFYDPIQLANRTQSVLQHAVPLNSPLRWNVLIQDNYFTFVLNRRFRMRMAASLAYIYGFILDCDGWITSPELQNSGMSNQKSILVAPNSYKLDTGIADLKPIVTPYFHRVKVHAGRLLKISVKAKNGILDVQDKVESVGPSSDAMSFNTKPQYPEPPENVYAQGVLDSVVIVTWVKPKEFSGSEVTHLELMYTNPNSCVESRRLPPTREGYDITGLSPGQTVSEIKVRCVSQIGPGRFSKAVSATTKCSIPSPPRNLQFLSSTMNSITFGWTLPAFDGGSPIMEWEISGSLPNGEVLCDVVQDTCCVSHTFEGIELASIGTWMLNVAVRCRNGVGWSKKSNKENGQCKDCDTLFVDIRRVRTSIKVNQQEAAVAALSSAIDLGHRAVAEAEAAARRPARFKKEMMENAENAVFIAECSLLTAIQESEDAGIKDLGVMQPSQDIEARKFLQSLQNKRGRRWGAINRGPQV